MRRMAIFVAAAVAGLVLATSASTMAVTKLAGTVGGGSDGNAFKIALTKGGKKVTQLKAGKYTFAVTDKASIHNFHVQGPGVNKDLTGVSFVGKKTITLKLKKGKYTYFCVPHAATLKGSFRVV